MNKKIRPEELMNAIAAELEAYNQEVTDQIKKDVKKIAAECVQEIKDKSPDRTGEYRDGWKKRTEFEGLKDIRISVYNSAKPSLTHLLEFGHAKRGGGRVEGIPHIYPAQENAAKKLEGKAKAAVKR